MEENTILAILKVLFIVLFVFIVIFVGILPLRLPNFKTNKLLKSLGTTFAGALFINVAIIHILPESANAIEDHLREQSGDEQVFPLANLLVMLGFLITVFFTRIISTHSHDDHPDEHHHEHSHDQLPHTQGQQNASLLTENDSKVVAHHKHKNDKDAYFLTMAMYFHTVFEGIAIGVQHTIGGFLSTAIAIAFHKWADALSMGIHYRNRNVSKRIAYGLIIGQALLNALSIGFGWAIDSFGDFTEAIFLSISAGTFLAISTMQMLGGQLHKPQYRLQKFLILIFSTGFISSVWFFQNAIFNDNSEQ